MGFILELIAIACGLMAAMLVLLEYGRTLGRRRLERSGKEPAGLGSLEGTVFTLLGLLIAFTFYGAAGRFDERRHLVAQEANDIGTAWSRLQLLQATDRGPLQALFRDYLDARLASHHDDGESEATLQARARAASLQQRIWDGAVAACAQQPPSTATLLLPAINAIGDIAANRIVASRSHPPLTIYALLFTLALVAALLAGYGMAANADRSWLHSILFALSIGGAVLVILDLESPRRGFIRVDAADQVLLDLRASFGR